MLARAARKSSISWSRNAAASAAASAAAAARQCPTTRVVDQKKGLTKRYVEINYAPEISRMVKGLTVAKGMVSYSGNQCRHYMVFPHPLKQIQRCSEKYRKYPSSVRTLNSESSSRSFEQTNKKQESKDVYKVEDHFDEITYNIPEKPVTFVEGASYSVVILAGLGLAALIAYFAFKELVFQPKEYKIFWKALERVQKDNQVTMRIGSPVTGYGQESRNRAARQRIPNEVWKDEDGVEHVKISFYIRGPHGYGQTFAEMFKDPSDKTWKFTYLVVEIKSPVQLQLMLESYIPS